MIDQRSRVGDALEAFVEAHQGDRCLQFLTVVVLYLGGHFAWWALRGFEVVR